MCESTSRCLSSTTIAELALSIGGGLTRDETNASASPLIARSPTAVVGGLTGCDTRWRPIQTVIRQSGRLAIIRPLKWKRARTTTGPRGLPVITLLLLIRIFRLFSRLAFFLANGIAFLRHNPFLPSQWNANKEPHYPVASNSIISPGSRRKKNPTLEKASTYATRSSWPSRRHNGPRDGVQLNGRRDKYDTATPFPSCWSTKECAEIWRIS